MTISDLSLLTDENINADFVAFLLESGFQVDDIKSLGLQKTTDRAILESSFAKNQVVVTRDSDFERIVFTEKVPFVSVLYLRPGHISSAVHIQTFKAILSQNLTCNHHLY